MANPEHVEILKKGIDVWNQWRLTTDIYSLEADLSGADLSGLNLNGIDLSYCDLEKVDLTHSSLERATLECSELFEAQLLYANLAGANLEGSNFSDAILAGSVLTGACLNSAKLSGANLVRVQLGNANLCNASLDDCNLFESNLCCADLSNANMKKSILANANLKDAILSNANLERADISDVRFSLRKGRFKGIRLAGSYGGERFKRYATHQAFIEELEQSNEWNRFLVGVWFVLADCGRSPWAWMGWSIIFCLYYAGIYLGLGVGAFALNTSLPFNFGSALYYSIVTFTTLGFGDITPATGLAAFYVTLEVITGYVMLGGLISFIFSKLLPRG
ncbi:pentapeptide repeat-containing protein [Tichowtungia aerotolerans]|uniref:Potassium channel domain-containing protein n=1 Tax=Tichowtungia aerotolerans TaxID=2697043 RepID=A0A6P1M6R5_9BACT|nr:pentapeptide repeat-containing protein [Tichowtungia aerotolerans]QHI69547.1 hypothetical protein GT409_08780 [Tichowtungia aerotolerans]